jgi:hypothetical protein
MSKTLEFLAIIIVGIFAYFWLFVEAEGPTNTPNERMAAEPSLASNWQFQVYEMNAYGSDNYSYTRFAFEGTLPKVRLFEVGNSYYWTELEDVNNILFYLGLPDVDHPTVDQEKLDGNRLHGGQYWWENYPLGKLELHRTNATGTAGIGAYNGIREIRLYRTETEDGI